MASKDLAMKISGTENGAGRIMIRRSSLDELPELMAVGQAAIYAARWSEQQWRDIFGTQNPLRLAWTAWDCGACANEAGMALTGIPAAEPGSPAPLGVAESLSQAASPRVVGFLVAQCGGAEWELENMAVLPAFRRLGAGSALLAVLLAEAAARKAERILLEVRPSNEAAIRLYRQGGFELLARRPGYYRDPAEDALIMVHVL